MPWLWNYCNFGPKPPPILYASCSNLPPPRHCHWSFLHTPLPVRHTKWTTPYFCKYQYCNGYILRKYWYLLLYILFPPTVNFDSISESFFTFIYAWFLHSLSSWLRDALLARIFESFMYCLLVLSKLSSRSCLMVTLHARYLTPSCTAFLS